MNRLYLKRIKSCIVIGLIGTMALTGCSRASGVSAEKKALTSAEPLLPVEEKVGNITVSVDPRIELLTAIQSQVAGYDRLITHYDFQYAKDVRDYFKPYQKEAAVKYHKKMGEKGFAYDAPPTVMMHYGSLPVLGKSLALDEELLARAGGQKKVDQFIEASTRFYEKSDFAKFYADHQEAYKEMVTKTAAYLKTNDPSKDLDQFFAMPRDGYHLVLSPMSKAGGYGPSIKNKAGGVEIYGIIGPTNVSSDKPDFDENSIHDLIWHEFSHSYVNPLTAEHGEAVKQLEPLFKPIEKTMDNMAYGQWEYALNEHIIRAINVRFIAQYSGDAAAKEMLESEYNAGFRYIKPLYEAIMKYEANRGTYKSFDQFFPELLKVLEPFNNEKTLTEIANVDFAGPINNAFMSDSPKLFVTGDPAKNPRYEGTASYAKEIQERFFKDSKVIYFEDLKNVKIADYTLVCYGTAEDLQKAFKTVELPYAFKEDTFVFGGKSYPSAKDLQFVTCLPNPENPKNGMIVYTAQRPEMIAGANDNNHGTKDYHLFQSGKEVVSGNYVKENGKWQASPAKTK